MTYLLVAACCVFTMTMAPALTMPPSMVSPLTLGVGLQAASVGAGVPGGRLTKVVSWLLSRSAPLYARWFLGDLACNPPLPTPATGCSGAFDSTKYPDGDYTLRVIAWDDQNRQGWSQVDVMIDNQTGQHPQPFGPTGLKVRRTP